MNINSVKVEVTTLEPGLSIEMTMHEARRLVSELSRALDEVYNDKNGAGLYPEMNSFLYNLLSGVAK